MSSLHSAPSTLPPGPGRVLFATVLAALLGLLTAAGAAAQSAAESQAESRAESLLQAVVGVRTRVPERARSASTLGVERTGSGAIIDGRGLVLTIGYLVLEAEQARVLTTSGERAADVIAYDHASGLGLLRMREPPSDIRPLRLGDASRLQPRSALVVAGYDDGVVAQPAVVTARRPFAGYWEYLIDNAIYAAPAHPLFGGAVALSAEGRLVGIGSLVLSNAGPDDRPLAGNLFVPVDELRPVLGDLLAGGDGGRQPRPWLGIYSQPLHGRLIITRVAVDGPAERAGLRRGDLLLAVAGQPVSTLAGFYRGVWALGEAGTTVMLSVQRGDTLLQVAVPSVDRRDWLAAARAE